MKYSLEGVSYIHDKRFVEQMDTESALFLSFIEKEKDDKKITDYLNKSKLLILLRERFNMNLSLEWVKDEQNINFFAHVPIIDKNNPLYPTWLKSYFNPSQSMKDVIKKKEILRSEVDLDRAKFSGFFSELEMKVSINSALKLKTDLFTPQELSAIIMHEIGHCFTLNEHLCYCWTENFVVRTHLEEFRQTKDSKMKSLILSSLVKEKYLTKEDRATVEQFKETEEGYLYLTKSSYQQTARDYQNKYSDDTMIEVMADNFATRLGFGQPLITALIKMEKFYNGNSARTVWLAYFFRMITAGMMVFFSVANPIFAFSFGLFYLMMSSFVGVMRLQSMYDKPKDRVEKIRREMIGTLKNYYLSESQKRELTKQIEFISQKLEEENKYLSSISFPWLSEIGITTAEWFNDFFKSDKYKFKSRNQAISEQNELERLLNNDLFFNSQQVKF